MITCFVGYAAFAVSAGVALDGPEMKSVIARMAAEERVSFRIAFDELDGDQFRVADPFGVSGTPAR